MYITVPRRLLWADLFCASATNRPKWYWGIKGPAYTIYMRHQFPNFCPFRSTVTWLAVLEILTGIFSSTWLSAELVRRPSVWRCLLSLFLMLEFVSVKVRLVLPVGHTLGPFNVKRKKKQTNKQKKNKKKKPTTTDTFSISYDFFYFLVNIGPYGSKNFTTLLLQTAAQSFFFSNLSWIFLPMILPQQLWGFLNLEFPILTTSFENFKFTIVSYGETKNFNYPESKRSQRKRSEIGTRGQ